MKKLTLDVEALEVTTFETSGMPAARGAVHGHDATHGHTCQISCDPSCISTCPVAPCYTGDETCVC